MSTPEETKVMHDILMKLQSTLANSEYQPAEKEKPASAAVPPSVSKNAAEMFNILSKLDEATKKATRQVLQETKSNPELSTSTYKNNTISVNGEYNIVMEKKQVVPGVRKTFYNILDHNHQAMYQDIALFESAMLIVKGLMTNKVDPEKIAQLDERYGSYLAEAAIYKQKVNTLTESYRVDLASAKHSVALDKMKQIKSQIKRFV
jgi:hypothetical protein